MKRLVFQENFLGGPLLGEVVISAWSGSGTCIWFPLRTSCAPLVGIFTASLHLRKVDIARSFALSTSVQPLRFAVGHVNVRSLAFKSWQRNFMAGRSVVRTYWCSRVGSHLKFELCGCTVTTYCRWWNVCWFKRRRCTGYVRDCWELSEDFNPENGEGGSQVCIFALGNLETASRLFRWTMEISGWRMTDEAHSGLPYKRFWCALSVALRSQEDERVETPRGTLPTMGTTGGGVPVVLQGTTSRENPGRRQPSSGAVPRVERGRSSAWRVRSAASIQPQVPEEFRSLGSRSTALDPPEPCN